MVHFARLADEGFAIVAAVVGSTLLAIVGDRADRVVADPPHRRGTRRANRMTALHPVVDTWVYLSTSPLLWLTLTLVAYLVAFMLYRRSGFNPLVNPVAIAVCVLVAILVGTQTSYATYFDGAQFVHFLLGPATVALAVPLYEQWGS